MGSKHLLHGSKISLGKLCIEGKLGKSFVPNFLLLCLRWSSDVETPNPPPIHQTVLLGQLIKSMQDSMALILSKSFDISTLSIMVILDLIVFGNW